MECIFSGLLSIALNFYFAESLWFVTFTRLLFRDQSKCCPTFKDQCYQCNFQFDVLSLNWSDGRLQWRRALRPEW
jgi:hypothetical protein